MNKYAKAIVPTVYICLVGIMIMCFILLISGIKNYVNESFNYNYTLDNVIEDVVPVVKTESDEIIRPYLSDNVKVGKYYYDFESDEISQENSLLYYEGIYMQNNGVDYVSNDKFDIVSILDGEVIETDTNEYYGNTLTIKHNDNLITVYSNITEVLPSVGYKVSQGEIIALSDKVNSKDNNYMLHFEVYYKGEHIDPENLYTIKVSDLQ